jgi:ribosomal protein S18 acetylase RimI-like enzyme
MAPTLSVRALAPDEWRTYKDVRLRALGDSPDAFGRTLVEEEERADTDWADRVKSAADRRWNLPLLAEADSKPIGLAWARIETSAPDVANLYQMWVEPSYRRLGVGRLLLDEVIKWAEAANVRCVALSVTCADSPATRLYRRTGFEPVGEPQPLRSGSALLAQPMQLVFGAEREPARNR